MQCFREQGYPSDELMNVEIRDDGLYRITCSKTHATIVAIQQLKFQILFDIGAMTLLDGYPREAITSIAAALERFYEFVVSAISIKHDIMHDDFTKTWKRVINQSERQYGAYLISFLVNFKKTPPTIEDAYPHLPETLRLKKQTWKEFRNNVIHKGYIPSSIEAVIYADLVFKHINHLIDELCNSAPAAIEKAVARHLSQAQKCRDGIMFSTLSVPTLIKLTNRNQAVESFEDALSVIKEYRSLFPRA